MEYTLYGKLYSTDITELDLSNNDLTYIDPNIKYFINLQTLILSCNLIKEIPKEIGYLTKLQTLSFSNNRIKEIPKEIQYLTQLKSLSFFRNQIKEISKEIQYLTELKKLDLYTNQIKEIPREIQYLTQLEELCVSYNQIKELPIEIINLRNLDTFIYWNNPIENLLNPIINRFITRIINRGGNIHNLYTATQNVHSSSIQQSIKDSIYNLMKEIKDDSKINYLDDNILSIQTKEALIEYSKDESIHSQLECTFEEVLQAVLLEINNLPNELQIEVKNRLNEEMEDGLCKCFTGRLSRLVNSLSGYSDKVSIKISSAEEIGNIISIMKDKYNEINEVKLNVEKELLERGYEKEVIDEWITYID
jgi:Leucine-rich repeat (LRR) protein